MTGRGRWDQDIQSCTNLFTALKIDLTEESIKFCRTVGDYGEAARKKSEYKKRQRGKI